MLSFFNPAIHCRCGEQNCKMTEKHWFVMTGESRCDEREKREWYLKSGDSDGAFGEWAESGEEYKLNVVCSDFKY